MFDLVPRCQVSRCPPLLYGAAFNALTGSAMSTLAIWCRVVQSRDVSPHNFDGLAMSSSAFSVAPPHRCVPIGYWNHVVRPSVRPSVYKVVHCALRVGVQG